MPRLCLKSPWTHCNPRTGRRARCWRGPTGRLRHDGLSGHGYARPSPSQPAKAKAAAAMLSPRRSHPLKLKKPREARTAPTETACASNPPRCQKRWTAGGTSIPDKRSALRPYTDMPTRPTRRRPRRRHRRNRCPNQPYCPTLRFERSPPARALLCRTGPVSAPPRPGWAARRQPPPQPRLVRRGCVRHRQWPTTGRRRSFR